MSVGQTAGTILIAAVVVGGILVLSDRMVLEPDNARILVNDTQRVFLSPPCAQADQMEDKQSIWDKVRMTTMKEVRDRRTNGEKWRPDDVCNRANGYWQRETLWHRVFGQESRWTDSGGWRW